MLTRTALKFLKPISQFREYISKEHPSELQLFSLISKPYDWNLIQNKSQLEAGKWLIVLYESILLHKIMGLLEST